MIRRATAADELPVGLDLHVATVFSATMLFGAIYERLTTIDPDLHLIPALAEPCTRVLDGLTRTRG